MRTKVLLSHFKVSVWSFSNHTSLHKSFNTSLLGLLHSTVTATLYTFSR